MGTMVQRTILLFLILCLLLSCFCSCKESKADGEGYLFLDDLGREVCVTSHERVAALLGSFADVWMLAGGTLCATADDAWDDFQLPLADGVVDLGGTKSLSLEALLSAAPDFVLASAQSPQHLEWRSVLEGAGITVAYFDVSGFEDYLRMLRICTDITGQGDLYETYGELQKTEINQIRARCKEKESKTVLVMRASAASIRAKNSEGTVLGGMLRDLGCVNIADSRASLLENLSVESILEEDPEFIFFVEVGSDLAEIRKGIEELFAENPLWNELTAVKEGRVYFMEKRLYNLKPNARFGEAYRKLEEILYAEA